MIHLRDIWRLAPAGLLLVLVACERGSDETADAVHMGERDVSLTLYSEGGALVRDRRELRLEAGEQVLLLGGLPHTLREDTLFVQTERAGVLSYRRGGVPEDRRSLWRRHIGETVTLVHEPAAGGSRERDRAGRLLGLTEGYPLVQSDGEVLWLGPDSHWRMRVSGHDHGPGPDTVALALEVPRDGQELLELRYRADGMAWQADYIAVLNDSASLMELTAHAGLLNRSGQDWVDVQVQLLAGEPRDTDDYGPGPLRTMQAEAAVLSEPVGEFHLFSLPHRVDIADGERLRVPFRTAREIPVRKTFLTDFRAGRQVSDVTEIPVETRLSFNNIASGLGEPLPAGVVRFYTRDRDGQTQWLGEARMDNIPTGQRVELSPGRAFDISASRQQTDYQRTGERETEIAWRVELANARDESVTVRVSENFENPTLILAQSHEHDRISSSRIDWPVTVPAQSTVRLEYRVRVRR